MLRSVSDQVTASHLFQSIAKQRPVIRVMIAKEGLMQITLLFTSGYKQRP